MEIFGEKLALGDFPIRKDIQGIGLSDWPGYAERLAEKFAYKNTFYHCDPLLDVSNPDPSEWGKYDFLISSDVFEHVPPPIGAAFEGVRKLLKPSGVMIFSVPYVDGFTKEHFPELHRFSIQKRNANHILSNETVDGRKQEFSDLTFHGGPGSTVEMRLFGRDSLIMDFRNAGFARLLEYADEVPEFGILWREYDPEKAPYRPLIYGLDTPPWAIRCFQE
jgi:SAM-dependent methyltransferase